jgi:hypothetical protein
VIIEEGIIKSFPVVMYKCWRKSKNTISPTTIPGTPACPEFSKRYPMKCDAF